MLFGNQMVAPALMVYILVKMLCDHLFALKLLIFYEFYLENYKLYDRTNVKHKNIILKY